MPDALKCIGLPMGVMPSCFGLRIHTADLKVLLAFKELRAAGYKVSLPRCEKYLLGHTSFKKLSEHIWTRFPSFVNISR